jgi:5-methylcytosine-specific restriction endonuclease McrA
VKPLDAFARDRRRLRGRYSVCKVCDVPRQAAAYQRRLVENRANNERYRRENLWRFAQKQANRRARQRHYWVEDVDRQILLKRDAGRCGICGVSVDPTCFDVDHIVPISRGGQHSYANTQIAHPRCNGRKRDKLMSDIAR